MTPRLFSPLVVGLAIVLAACSSALYEQNIRETYVTPWTKISDADRAQIIRLVTSAALNEILGITRYAPEEGRSGYHVYTGGTDVCYDFYVEPAASGWRIIRKEPITCAVATGVALTFPPKSLRKW